MSARPVLGLIVLQVDETIEDDFRRLFPPDAARLHVTRIPSGADLTPATIATMESALPGSAALLPAAGFDAVGYGCTSGATLLGRGRVAALITGATGCAVVRDPMSAAIEACTHLGIGRLGLVTPYVAEVADPLRAAFEAEGIAVPQAMSFNEVREAAVARIATARVADAARTVAGRGGIDGLFLSCTNLRTLEVIPSLERSLGLPVLSSNRVLAWSMARAAGGVLPLSWAF